jgi:hypothetical protein
MQNVCIVRGVSYESVLCVCLMQMPHCNHYSKTLPMNEMASDVHTRHLVYNH